MRRLIKKYGKYVIWAVAISFLLGALVIFTPGKLAPPPGGRAAREPILIVNGEKITQAEFNEQYENLLNYYRQLYARNRLGSFDLQLRGPSGAVYQLQLKSDVLNDLIRKVLLEQEARRMGIEVTEAELEAELDRWVEREFQYVLDYYGMTEEELKERLEQEGMSLDEFKQQIRKEIEGRKGEIHQRLLEDKLRAQVVKGISPTEEELKKYFEEHKPRYATPEMVRARHILIKVAEDAPEEEVAQARARIEEIKRKLDEGADFAELAKEYSEDEATAPEGGDLGWFQRGQMVKEFEEAAFALEVGQISDIVRTKYGFHIIKLEDRRPAKGFEDVKEQVRQDYLEEKRQEKFDEWYEGLREAAEIEIKEPVLRAYMLEREGKKDEALAAYEELIQEGKVKDPYLHYYAARLYEDKLDAAKAELAKLKEEEEPDEAKLAELEARVAELTEKVKEHLHKTLEIAGGHRDLFSELLLYDPENPDIYYEYGKYLRETGRYDEAIEKLKKALELKPDHSGALILYADLMLDKKEYDEAIAHYEKALTLIQEDPKLTARVLTRLGRAYMGKEDYAKAEELFAQVLEETPDDQEVLTLMGDALFAQERYADAATYYDKALKAGGVDPKIQVKLGNAYLEAGELEQASEIFDAVIKGQSFYAADAYLGMGDVHRAKGLTEKALEDYKEGFKRSQYRTELRIKLGERILELDPQDVETRFDLARTYQRAHKFDEAIEHYQVLLEQQPESIEAYQGLAECYEEKEDYAKAKEIYKRGVAVAEQPKDKIMFYKKIVEVEEELVGEGEPLGEDGLEALLNLAKLYLDQGKKDEARQQLERLKEENPDYRPEEVAQLLAQIEAPQTPPAEVEAETETETETGAETETEQTTEPAPTSTPESESEPESEQ